MIAEGFPDDRLRITGNPHFEHFTEHITREAEERSRVVFVSQPIRQDAAEGCPPVPRLMSLKYLSAYLRSCRPLASFDTVAPARGSTQIRYLSE